MLNNPKNPFSNKPETLDKKDLGLKEEADEIKSYTPKW